MSGTKNVRHNKSFRDPVKGNSAPHSGLNANGRGSQNLLLARICFRRPWRSHAAMLPLTAVVDVVRCLVGSVGGRLRWFRCGVSRFFLVESVVQRGSVDDV